MKRGRYDALDNNIVSLPYKAACARDITLWMVLVCGNDFYEGDDMHNVRLHQNQLLC